MAFKSEIHVAELASIRTGHTEGDIYYILDNGMLGELPCKPGNFVKWHNDTWQILPDEHYALASAVDGEIAQAIDNLLDNGQASEAVVVAVPSSQSGDYTVGDYYEVQGKVAKLRTKTEGDNVTQLTFDTTSGVLEAINGSREIAVFMGYSNPGGTSLPNPEDVIAAVEAGKAILLQMQVQSNLVLYAMVEAALGSAPVGDEVYLFRNLRYANGRYYRLRKVDDAWTWDYYTTSEMPYSTAIAADYSSLTFPIAEGTACMHDGLRYTANTDISTSESWTAAHWDQTSVEDTIGSISGGSEVYSRNETPVGTWVDGRTIYRKVVQVTGRPGERVWTNVYPDSGIDIILTAKGLSSFDGVEKPKYLVYFQCRFYEGYIQLWTNWGTIDQGDDLIIEYVKESV